MASNGLAISIADQIIITIDNLKAGKRTSFLLSSGIKAQFGLLSGHWAVVPGP